MGCLRLTFRVSVVVNNGEDDEVKEGEAKDGHCIGQCRLGGSLNVQHDEAVADDGIRYQENDGVWKSDWALPDRV